VSTTSALPDAPPPVVAADDAVAADLSAYAARLVRLDPAAVLRVVVRGGALGVFARPPFGVLAFRGFPLASGGGGIDRTVIAAGLRVQGSVVVLPASGSAPAWTGVLPPRSGWSLLGTRPVLEVVTAVRDGVLAFRNRGDALAPADRTPAVLARVADEVWAERVVGPVTLRAAHAALRLGFLSPRLGGDVVARGCGPWLRLEGRHGVVFTRRDDAIPLRLA
jgi:hypothetical protein